ncbi:hypothetical protein [Rhizobium sp. NPDC090279]|uniref:hypothetical protein n=1 Tax=Rhizobium sp. NPDC090279 TaxID=3364499 RepID=UPI00383BC9CE
MYRRVFLSSVPATIIDAAFAQPHSSEVNAAADAVGILKLGYRIRCSALQRTAILMSSDASEEANNKQTPTIAPALFLSIPLDCSARELAA